MRLGCNLTNAHSCYTHTTHTLHTHKAWRTREVAQEDRPQRAASAWGRPPPPPEDTLIYTDTHTLTHSDTHRDTDSQTLKHTLGSLQRGTVTFSSCSLSSWLCIKSVLSGRCNDVLWRNEIYAANLCCYFICSMSLLQ